MKLARIGVLMLFLSAFALQSCGSSKSDTSGTLTISKPTVTDQKCGIHTVDATVTYTPPVGKVPNGVQVVVSEFEDGILMHRTTETLTDSPSVNFTYVVSHQNQVTVSIDAAIGDMNSSVVAFVPFSNLSGCSL